MNHKILNKLEQLIHTSPQLLRNPNTLRQAIQGTFDVDIEEIKWNRIKTLPLYHLYLRKQNNKF